jgi:hypothetical protein
MNPYETMMAALREMQLEDNAKLIQDDEDEYDTKINWQSTIGLDDLELGDIDFDIL